VSGQFEDDEANARGDQQTADDRVLGALDGRAELQADRDDHTAQHDREQNVRDASED
jgi:hypothetical protein